MAAVDARVARPLLAIQSAGRGLASAAAPASWHNPHHRFTRVINVRSRVRTQDPPRPGEVQAGGLHQTEFSRPADRRTPVANAELAVHGALVGLHGIERDI
jgi:hypothetical protein